MITSEDIKVLQFKDDLFKLLKKYKYSIEGSHLDNGDIIIETQSQDYILNNEGRITRSDFDSISDIIKVDVMKDYITESFKGDSQSDFCFGNFGCYDTGIITNDRSKADCVIKEIVDKLDAENIRSYIMRRDFIYLAIVNSGNYIWVRPEEYIKGYRFKNVYIDCSVDLDIFENVIRPICCYCGEDNVHVI